MELLKQLSLISGVPGQEHRVRDLIIKKYKGLFDEMSTDGMGNLIALRKARPAKGKKPGKNGEKPVKVMIAAHMDQIGFVVRYIDDRGFVRIQNRGGFDTRNLLARMVTICPDPSDPSKDLLGVMNPGGRPIHIASEEDKKKIPDIHDFVIDLGRSAAEVNKLVKIGDMVTLRAQFDEVGEMYVGQAMDNRIACWWTIRAIEQLKHHDCDIYAAFTVQEEVGCRGAVTAAEAINPDVGISLEVTLAVDTPGVTPDQSVTTMGNGVALMVQDSSVICDIDLVGEFEAVAKKHKVKVQRALLPKGGNDANAIQKANHGHRVITLACPTRNIHTVTEAISKHDAKSCVNLLTAYLSDLK